MTNCFFAYCVAQRSAELQVRLRTVVCLNQWRGVDGVGNGVTEVTVACCERAIKREREESHEIKPGVQKRISSHSLFSPHFSLSKSLLSITSEFSSFTANFVTVSFKFYKAFRDEKDVMNPPAPVSSLPAELS